MVFSDVAKLGIEIIFIFVLATSSVRMYGSLDNIVLKLSYISNHSV